MITQLYRVSLESEKDFNLIMKNPQDMRLVLAFKDVQLAREKAGKLRQKPKYCCAAKTPRVMKTEKNILDEDFSPNESIEGAVMATTADIEEAERRLALAERKLKQATKLAKADWRKRPNRVALERVKLVNKQKSQLMKIAALVAQDATPAAKARRALCPHWFVYLSWALILTLFGISAFYVVRFILTRADRAELPQVERTEEELIQVWLFSACLGILVGYCIAEPLIAITRYALVPFCVEKCLSSDSEEDDVEAEEDVESRRTLGRGATKLQRSMGSYELRTLSEGDQDDTFASGEMKQSRAQYVLEFLSELIETIY